MRRPNGWASRVYASLSEMLLIGIVVGLVVSTTCVASYSDNSSGMVFDSDDQDDGPYSGESGESGEESGARISVDVTSWLHVSSEARGASAGVTSKVYAATSKVSEEIFEATGSPAAESALQDNQKDPNSPAMTIVVVIICVAVVVVVVVVVMIVVVVKRNQRFVSITRSKDVSTNDSNIYQRQYARIPPSINGTNGANQSSTSHGTCNPMYDEI